MNALINTIKKCKSISYLNKCRKPQLDTNDQIKLYKQKIKKNLNKKVENIGIVNVEIPQYNKQYKEFKYYDTHRNKNYQRFKIENGLKMFKLLERKPESREEKFYKKYPKKIHNLMKNSIIGSNNGEEFSFVSSNSCSNIEVRKSIMNFRKKIIEMNLDSDSQINFEQDKNYYLANLLNRPFSCSSN